MSSPADATIAALRTGHDDLVAVISALPPDTLTGPSACAQWDLSEVLSHLGSGAQISLGGLQKALDPTFVPEPNQDVWDRWNAMSPQDRATTFVTANEATVTAWEALDEATRSDLRIDLGFLPAPVDVALAAGMRLNEFALHSWDVRVVVDPAATVAADAASALVDNSGLLLGWIGKADQVSGPVTLLVETTTPERSFGLAITDQVAMTDAPTAADGTLRLEGEAWLRLTTGRLDPDHTPSSVAVQSDSVTLADLRRVFPGY